MKARKFTDGEINFLQQYYPVMPTSELAAIMDRSEKTIYHKAHALGLKKNQEYLNSPFSGRMKHGDTKGLKTRFIKGHIPANKGKKMSPELKKKLQHTFYKKGNLPANTLYNGAITIRKDKRGILNKFIRLALSKWEYLSRYIWEQHNGKIPRGYNIIFKDADTMNCNIDNLELLSNAELMKRNSIHNYPEEIRKAIHLRGVLTRTIKQVKDERE